MTLLHEAIDIEKPSQEEVNKIFLALSSKGSAKALKF